MDGSGRKKRRHGREGGPHGSPVRFSVQWNKYQRSFHRLSSRLFCIGIIRTYYTETTAQCQGQSGSVTGPAGLSVPPLLSVSRLVRSLKGKTSCGFFQNTRNSRDGSGVDTYGAGGISPSRQTMRPARRRCFVAVSFSADDVADCPSTRRGKAATMIAFSGSQRPGGIFAAIIFFRLSLRPSTMKVPSPTA